MDRSCYWLLFVASDVELLYDPAQLVDCSAEAIDAPKIGVYTPSLRHDSQAAFPICHHFDTGQIRQCYLTDGFFHGECAACRGYMVDVDGRAGLPCKGYGLIDGLPVGPWSHGV